MGKQGSVGARSSVIGATAAAPKKKTRRRKTLVDGLNSLSVDGDAKMDGDEVEEEEEEETTQMQFEEVNKLGQQLRAKAEEQEKVLQDTRQALLESQIRLAQTTIVLTPAVPKTSPGDFHKELRENDLLRKAKTAAVLVTTAFSNKTLI